MKILKYGNRKIDDIAWDASTPELESQAFLELFRYFDGEYWQMYADPPTGKQKALYEKAKFGDAEAARKLLQLRKTYEYEAWELPQGKVMDHLQCSTSAVRRQLAIAALFSVSSERRALHR